MSQVLHPANPPQSRETALSLPAEIPKQTVLDYLTAFGLATQLTEPEKLQFIEIAQAFGLNPFKREVHVAVYGDGEYRKLSIITGYEVYLKRAERTGKLDGWRAWIEGQGEDMKALVEIHRKDWTHPFVHEVYWREAVQKKKDGTPTAFWSKQPRFQLRKVALSQGFRLAFPDELGGMPYDAAELPDGESLGAQQVSQLKPVVAAEPVATAQEETPVPEQPIVLPTFSGPNCRDQHGSEQQGFRDPYPGQDKAQLFERLQSYLEDNAEAFTDKHCTWIIQTASKARDREGVIKMMSYAQKVVRNAGAALATA